MSHRELGRKKMAVRGPEGMGRPNTLRAQGKGGGWWQAGERAVAADGWGRGQRQGDQEACIATPHLLSIPPVHQYASVRATSTAPI